MPLLTRPDDKQLTVESARARTSSYIYGNILVLAATLGVSVSSIEHGAAVITVLGTAVTTFLAHVLSHIVSHRIGHEDDDRDDPEAAAEARETAWEIVRDAWPIVTSGLIPVILLAAAWLGWLPAQVAQSVSAIVLIGRIALIGLIIQRLSGRKASFWAFWSGIGIAVLALAVVALKLALGH